MLAATNKRKLKYYKKTGYKDDSVGKEVELENILNNEVEELKIYEEYGKRRRMNKVLRRTKEDFTDNKVSK